MVQEINLAQTGTDWRAKIAELQAQLDELKPRLVEAEAELADRLSAISVFEFNVRARLQALIQRLDKLEVQIKSLRHQLRRLQDAWLFDDLEDLDDEALRERLETWRYADDESATSGEYRYRQAPSADRTPSPTLSPDDEARLKQLYRRLARRFHPDFALDEADRAYRTDLMMAINAAYAAGDIARLEELAQRPDSAAQKTYSDAELVAALENEIEQCRVRLTEIRQELARLERHQSAVLMRRAERATAEGRDLLAEMATDLRSRIAHKMAERDILEAEIEAYMAGQPEYVGEDFADAVYDLGLEQAYDHDSLTEFSEWRDRNRGRFDLDEADDDEEEWRSIRKASSRRRRP